MWILYTLIANISYAIADVLMVIYLKKNQRKSSILNLRISVTFLGFIVALICCACGIGETGFNSVITAFNNPIVFLPLIFTTLESVLFLLSLYFIGLSVAETIESFNGLVVFIGLIIVNAITGSFKEISLLLSPLKIILFIIIVLLIVLLPNVEQIGKKHSSLEEKEHIKVNKKKMIIGIILAILAAIFDGTESVVSSYVIQNNIIGPIDYTFITYFYGFVIGIIYFTIVKIKTKKFFNPFAKGNRITLLTALLVVVSSVAYFLALKNDAVKTNLLTIIYPIYPVTLAFIFLKEKYSWKQLVVILSILAFTMAFVFIYNL